MIRTDLAGQKFGRLTVLSKSDSKADGYGWICQCECGNITLPIRGTDLRRGKRKSCGCAKHDGSARRKHGGRGTKLYEVFKTMQQRCNNPNSQRYPYYGGRGIKVCEEWSDYNNFKSWALNNGYADGLTLERVDNNGNYAPDNCRWATVKEQSNNRRNNVMIEIDGTPKTVAQWAAISGVSRYTIYSRVKRGVTGRELIERSCRV